MKQMKQVKGIVKLDETLELENISSFKWHNCIYVLLPDIIYVMQSGRFSQYPADGKRAG